MVELWIARWDELFKLEECRGSEVISACFKSVELLRSLEFTLSFWTKYLQPEFVFYIIDWITVLKLRLELGTA